MMRSFNSILNEHFYFSFKRLIIILAAILFSLSFPCNVIAICQSVIHDYYAGNPFSKPGIRGDTTNIPSLVKPEINGTLRLDAKVGKGIGPEIKYMPEWEAFGWFGASDHVEWDVEVKKKGAYEVYLEWSVDDDEAGKTFVFEAGGKELTGAVEKTGSWEQFKEAKIGTVNLSAGRQKMIFKSGSEFKEGALLDLRALRLVPVQ